MRFEDVHCECRLAYGLKGGIGAFRLWPLGNNATEPRQPYGCQHRCRLRDRRKALANPEGGDAVGRQGRLSDVVPYIDGHHFPGIVTSESGAGPGHRAELEFPPGGK